MEKDIVIDNMLENIIQCFDNDEITDSVIKKLVDFRKKTNLNMDDNSIVYKSPSFLRKITVKPQENVIEVSENGRKMYDNVTKIFENNLHYGLKNGNGLIIKSSKDIKYENKGLYDTKIEEDFSIKNYYRDGKRYASITNKIFTKKITDEKRNVIGEKTNSIKKINYSILFGDYIQLLEDNDTIKYYYCKKDEEDIIKIEISKEEFERFIMYKDNLYDLLNDNVLRKIRK